MPIVRLAEAGRSPIKDRRKSGSMISSIVLL